MKHVVDMFGGETDWVIVVGVGGLEAVSGARLCLAILLCCYDEDSRNGYNYHDAGKSSD